MARVIVFLIFGGFGLVMLYVGTTQYFRQRRLLSRAQPVTVTIVKSEVITSQSANTDRRLLRNNSTTSHRPEIRFRYQVNGKNYESDLLHPNIIVVGYASRDSAAEVLKPYPVNAEVNAFVDPTAPESAYLIAEAGAGPIVFIIVGLLLPPIAWLVGKWI